MDISKRYITNFIKEITDKNYARANKYLQAALYEKVKSKVKAVAKTKNLRYGY